MANTKHGLPQTKGIFKLRGYVTGMQRDNTFKDIETRSGKKMNLLNFGVETAPESTVFVTVQGMERDEVYFSKRVGNGKTETKKVAWAKRFDDQGEGYELIGVAVGLEKDENGKNVKHTYTEFDAAEKIYEQLEDGMPVFVQGEIEFSSFKRDNGEISRNKRFNVRQIYNSSNVDFEAPDFKETSDFKQKIIFMNIEKDNESEEPRFIVEAKIVNYNSIEDAEFIIYNKALANNFRGKLKPYTAIDVWGKIVNKIDTDEVEEVSNVWGEEDTFKRINKSYVRELVITGASPDSIDTETYTEEAIEEAIKKLNSEGQVDSSWGDSDSDISDEDLPW
jgi:hypothetical protein